MKILGFRSGKTWKKVIATIGYLMIISVVYGAFNGGDTKPTTATVSEIAEQQAKEKADAELKAKQDAKISDSDKELLKKSYSTFSDEQEMQFAEIEKKYKILSNAEVADISADFARLSTEKIAEEKKLAEIKAALEAGAAYQKWVKAQFSAWDGSNRYLVNLLKDNLNDAKSFEHVDTSYADKGDHLIIKMTYRAKNGFGGLVLQNVTAKSDYKTNVISIVSQNN